jgi:hypothetical protein
MGKIIRWNSFEETPRDRTLGGKDTMLGDTKISTWRYQPK